MPLTPLEEAYAAFDQRTAGVSEAGFFQQKRPGVVQTARFTSEFLLPTQAHYPSTEHTERFCLLCFQPRPLLTSLSARWPEASA